MIYNITDKIIYNEDSYFVYSMILHIYSRTTIKVITLKTWQSIAIQSFF